MALLSLLVGSPFSDWGISAFGLLALPNLFLLASSVVVWLAPFSQMSPLFLYVEGKHLRRFSFFVWQVMHRRVNILDTILATRSSLVGLIFSQRKFGVSL